MRHFFLIFMISLFILFGSGCSGGSGGGKNDSMGLVVAAMALNSTGQTTEPTDPTDPTEPTEPPTDPGKDAIGTVIPVSYFDINSSYVATVREVPISPNLSDTEPIEASNVIRVVQLKDGRFMVNPVSSDGTNFELTYVMRYVSSYVNNDNVWEEHMVTTTFQPQNTQRSNWYYIDLSSCEDITLPLREDYPQAGYSVNWDLKSFDNYEESYNIYNDYEEHFFDIVFDEQVSPANG